MQNLLQLAPLICGLCNLAVTVMETARWLKRSRGATI